MLHVPGCPLLPRLVALLVECQTEVGHTGAVEVLVGDFPSPTLVIDGVDVAAGRTVAHSVCCRLDLPTRDQVLAALGG